MPDIAVLLPSYNPGPELVPTLDSLRAQTVPFRLFLVDDGSARPADYDAATAGMDVQIIRLPQNVGITGALNAGVAAILREPFSFIARIDVGDLCKPERFARQLAFLQRNPDVGIVGSAVLYRLYDASHQLTGEKTMHYPEGNAACVARLPFNSPINHPAMMMRRQVLETLQAYSDDFPAAEDYDLVWRAHQAGFALANLPDVLLIKEETPQSISQRRRRTQVQSRLRLQWRNLNGASPQGWLGLAKSVVTLSAPAGLISALKFLRR